MCTPAKPLPAHFCPYSEPRRGWPTQGEPPAAAGTCGIRGTAECAAGVRQPRNDLSRRAGHDQEQRKTGSVRRAPRGEISESGFEIIFPFLG